MAATHNQSSIPKGRTSTLSWQDLELLKPINSILAPLAKFTELTFGENYVTISVILLVLGNSVLTDNSDDNPMIKRLQLELPHLQSRQFNMNRV